MQTPVNKNATKNARRLLEFLCQTAGNKIITGQHTQTVPMEEVAYIKDVTGKEPLLRGFELLSYSPNINYADASRECLEEIEQNKGTLQTALEYGRRCKENPLDGILTFSFHWFSPLGGRDKSFYARNTDFDASKVLQQNSAERAAFFSDMEKIADLLQAFRAEDIPILWRPFHESDGDWFWWGAKGPEVARELYKLMFDYFVNVRRLDNLLWVWNCALSEGYPGDECVDVISVDVYLKEKRAADYADEYKALVERTTKNKVAALAEVGYIPDITLLEKSRVPWAYYMAWSKEFCIGERYNSKEELRRMYQSPYALCSAPAPERAEP